MTEKRALTLRRVYFFALFRTSSECNEGLRMNGTIGKLTTQNEEGIIDLVMVFRVAFGKVKSSC